MDFRLLVSSSVIPFREKAEKAWNIRCYRWPKDILRPCVFFGMYHIGDLFHFIRHFGKKIIFFAGSDITNLINSHFPVYKLFRNTKCYCENEVEKRELTRLGIWAEIRPSFLEDINSFPVRFKLSKRPQVYLSARPGREKEYGVELVKKIAPKIPEVIFHIYGCDVPKPSTEICEENIIYEGKVSPKKFNEDIRNYHCGLRINEHNGASEIMVKSILNGGYPITRIDYPYVDCYNGDENKLINLLRELKYKTKPNYKAREFWLKNINNVPWNNKKR